MKINTNILAFLMILLVSIAVPILVEAAIQPNDYVAWVFTVHNFEMRGEDQVNIEYAVGYIPIQGSATYTYTKANLVTEINMSNPSTINSRMRATILDFATSKGYNVKKIIYQDYNVAKI